MKRTVAVVSSIVALSTACAREEQEAAAPTASSIPLAVSASATLPLAKVFPSATPSASAPTKLAETTIEKELRTSPLTALAIVSWSKPGLMNATLERPRGAGQANVTLTLALDQHPLAYRRPLAFALLARELGMHVVPATIVRRISTGELGAVFSAEPDARAYLSQHAAIQNDGTIDALLVAPSRGDVPRAWEQAAKRDIVLEEAPEARAWALWAASSEPVPGENSALLRDYVEALVLDYLTCNLKRRSVLLDEAAAEIVLTDNEGAFPPKVDPNVDAHLLERLKPVRRFPKTLRDALQRLSRTHARELINPGAFDSWLLPPRQLMNLDERRITLLTLIEARVADQGDAAVLCL